MAFIQTIAAFIVALGLLVTIHEYGHYWVARKVGVKILRFSVGFGKPIFTRIRGADKTEFTIAAIPLGGYVKMLDEREGEVPEELRHRAFNNQSLRDRSAIVVAGPLANLAFAVFAYWAMYLVGVSGTVPIVGTVADNSVAATSGIQAGDTITHVDGEPAPTWDTVFRTAISAVLDAGALTLSLRSEEGRERDVVLDFASISVDDISEGGFFEKVGFEPFRVPLPAKIGRVVPGEPAASAGLRAGDLILAADGEAIEDWYAWVEYIRGRPEQDLVVQLLRGGETLSVSLRPALVSNEGQAIGRIGAEVDQNDVTPLPRGVEKYGAVAAIPRAFARTGEMVTTTLKFMKKMIVGEASVKNLSGPISIASYAGQSAKLGLSRFLHFLGLVSISLGVLNLLPIPLLDGGHLMYYLLEFVTRRPVPETVQLVGQQVGFAMLLGLMGLAVYNDIVRMM